MPYRKIPELRYQLFGGINSKISPYLNSPMEFLRLENLDFQTPGSLSERWGSTQYFGNSLSGKVNGLYEFTQTTGASSLYASAGGTMGIVLNNGFSAIFSGSTAGASYFSSFSASFIDGISLQSLDQDFDTLQNNAFLSNGSQFFKSTGGSSFVFFGLPRFKAFRGVAAPGSSGVADAFTGMILYKFAWINSYGMAGAPTQFVRFPTPAPIQSTQGATQLEMSFTGSSFILKLVPPNYDISAIGIFRADSISGAQYSTYLADASTIQNALGQTTSLFNSLDNLSYKLVGVVGVSAGSIAATFVDTNYGGGITFLNNNILPWDWYPQDYSILSMGLTAPVGFGVSLIPKFVETHGNRLFIAGISAIPSSFGFSEENEPEHFEADSIFEVRTQDGQALTAMKEYNGNLMLFKTNSFHQLSTGAIDPSNWILTQISSEYGCLGNRAVATYANWCVFLDRKGIIRYNGANIEILSTKVDPIFQRMNLSAASGSVMTYDKQRNEILCDIPVDGSTMNNLTVVWDIVSNAWTTYTGYRSAVTAIAQGQLSNKQVFYGGYSGLVSYFGPSFLTDNGIGFTCVAKSGFFTDLGESVTKVFRRLFLDTNPVGASSFIDVNLYQDFGSSIVVSATMVLNDFQNRMDFGVSGKALSVEFMCGSTIGLALHGFAVQYRFQRNV